MKKKALREELRDAGARIQQLADLLAAERRIREEQHEAMLAAGYLYVGPHRSEGDRLRAVSHGVLILDDVQLHADQSIQEITVDEPPVLRDGPWLRGIAGREHHVVTLKFEIAPKLADALSEHVRGIGRRSSAPGGRIHP